jgi:DNA helicase-2/ATP-dependent DNA helicase PcrA
MMKTEKNSPDAVVDRLNPSQRRAACHGQSPLLIIAGAGTGKTTTLVHRVAYLMAEGVPPQRLLLLTFTRRAAGEMLRRAQRVVSRSVDSRQVWGGTFHATGTRLLRIYGELIEMDGRFTMHDRSDSEDLMKGLLAELKLAQDDRKFPKKGTCMAIHSFCVNSGMPLARVLQSFYPSLTEYAPPLERLFAAYTQRKGELSVLDYDDLLLKWLELLEHPEAGERIRARFDGVLVDEYQDTNPLQAKLIKALCPEGQGLTVVGDDAQSIYAFRAATVRNILDFPKQFPGTTVVKLEQNYRSTPPLLEASNRVMAEAREKYTKKLWSARKEGPRPQLVTCYDQDEQTEFVVRRILEHRRSGIALRSQAVLFRASHHSIALEAELAHHDIPFVKYGGLKFVESAHVKDLMSLLRLAENPRDLVAGTRALSLLPGIGPKTALRWLDRLSQSESGFQVWTDEKPPSKAAECWPKFVALLQRLETDQTGDLPRQVHLALEFYQPLLEEMYDNAALRRADLEQLEQLASRFPDRATMLADLTIDPPTSEADLPRTSQETDHLVLSTMHSAKGLEWPVVFVLHASDGMIPMERYFDDSDQLEEERRLFYVALTRAADWLYVCHCKHHQPSFRRGWNDWGDDGRRVISRFVTPKVKASLQCQKPSTFRVDPSGPSPKPKGRPKKKRAKSAK